MLHRPVELAGGFGNFVTNLPNFTGRTRDLSAFVSMLNYDGLSFVDRLAGRDKG